MAFSDLTCHLEDTGKNTGVVLVPCCTLKCAPTAISGGVHISEVTGCYLLQQMSSQWGHKGYVYLYVGYVSQGYVSHEFTAYLSVFELFLTK